VDEDAPVIADGLRQALLGHAVALAKRATELEPEQADFWNTLGLAHYCAGDFASALAALQQEHELLGDGQAGNLLCLALAEHRLGNEGLALDLYQRALLWMATHETDANLRWFQAEAQRVLGV